MIPLRVYLKNFLCHAEQEFRFDDHPVWLLHGPNGVGKSAVFDAMVYALYGESRRSDTRKNVVADVIRHGESSMRVEFDFELGGQRYRVWRIRPRSGQPKQGVSQCLEGQWTSIKDVSLNADLNDWVIKKLGLNYDTFVSTVLLRQGAAEKLIDADRATRQNLFRSFIDLEPYMRLHDRVATERTKYSGEARHLRVRLAGMPPVSEEQIGLATTAAQESEEALQRARSAENAARDRLGHARIWEQNDGTRRRIQAELNAANGRARDAARLERDFERLRELRTLVAGLIEIGDLSGALGIAEGISRQKNDELAAAKARNGELRTEISQARSKITYHREQQAELDRNIQASEAEQTRISTEIDRAEKATELHEKLAKLRTTEFESDIEARSAGSEIAVANAQSAKDALPHLQALSLRRGEYRRAVDEEQNASAEEKLASADHERLNAAEIIALRESCEAKLRQSEAENAAAVAKDQHETAVKVHDRFGTTAAGQICSECWQPISATHAAKERAKLASAVEAAQANQQRCDAAVRAANVTASDKTELHRQIQLERQAAERRRDSAATSRTSANTRATQASAEFDRVFSLVAEPFARHVAAIGDDGYPTKDDLAEIGAAENSLADLLRLRDELRQRLIDRDQNRHDIETLESSLALFGPPAEVSVMRDELAKLEARMEELRDNKNGNDRGLKAEQEIERGLLSEEEDLAEKLPQLAADVARAESSVSSKRRQLDDAIEAIPEPNRATALTTTQESRQGLVDELDQLDRAGIEERFHALAQDRALHSERERQLVEVQQQIDLLPEDVHCPASEIERAILEAESATSASDQLHETNRTALRTLVEQREQRRLTDQELCQAERDHAMHDQLADLLGAEGIQLDLARSAECRIIARANEILVRLSSGELRFEPPNPESARAFDLSVRRMGCPEPIAVENLSGGQRFRVAISLALAVCQGAGGDARRLESVIIDEGFGSLDRDGRTAMIAELRDGNELSRMFKRVLIVSHQDDFASAFPVGYVLSAQGGTTIVETFGCN